MDAYAWRHGQRRTAEGFGVSRHTVWRFLYRGHAGRRLPRAVLDSFDGDFGALISATWKLNGADPILALDRERPYLAGRLRDTLTLLCATPLSTVDELSSIGRVPDSTFSGRSARLTERGLVDSIPHRLSILGPHATCRYFPTKKGIVAAGAAARGLERLLETRPVSRQWLRLLAERLDAVAVLYHAAAMVADADPSGDPARVDRYRHGPYDLLITLSGNRLIGLIRHGPVLPNANLRYPLRSKEHLGYFEEPLVTLVLTHSTQSMRRAIRSLGDLLEHGTTLVACVRELLTGGAGAYAWQLCGTGRDDDPPDLISPDIRLKAIVRWSGRLVDRSDYPGWKRPTVDPESLYSPDLRATMPKPTEQLRSALAVQLTRTEKDALDLRMPGCDGIDLMNRILRKEDIPVIFVSVYGQDDVIARAFDMGAADYVVKPFSPTELAERIRATLRKRAVPSMRAPYEPYAVGDLTIDYAERRVRLAGRQVDLTPTEFGVLHELSVHGGRPLTHDQLLQQVWGMERRGEPWLVREVVKRLRRKLGDDAQRPRYILTETRVGYRMARSEEWEHEAG